jgi:DNA-binding transcriptional ArsR family regulator
MGEIESARPDPFDPARLRLKPTSIGKPSTRARLPRHRYGEALLKGPIPYPWISTACRLPGSGLHIALTVRFLRGRYQRCNRWCLDVIAKGLGLSESTARRGLHAAEEAGLLIASRQPGCKSSLELSNVTRLQSDRESSQLCGPIPWAWLLPAIRLPGSALQVAMACWLSAEAARTAEFELVLGDWADLGLSRQAAGRGLDALVSAGLVSVTPRAGRSPIVLIVDRPLPG